MASRGCGCLPFLVGGLILTAWLMQDVAPPPVQIEQYDPRSPRRPLPQWGDEQFVIDDRPGERSDSMGTSFAVDRDGVWMTAAHVTDGCERVGLEHGPLARQVPRVVASAEADAAVVPEGPRSPDALPLSDHVPPPGSPGYHMGFPAGQPTLVLSELIGPASARRGRTSSRQPVLAWAEEGRIPSSDGPLSGISGGPVFAEDGHVVGVNSASTDRRGRILTAAPDAMTQLARVAGHADDRPVAYPIAGHADAQDRFDRWLDEGVIRRIFCNVR